METSQVYPPSIPLEGLGLGGGHEGLTQLKRALLVGALLVDYAFLLVLFEFLPGLLKGNVIQTEPHVLLDNVPFAESACLGVAGMQVVAELTVQLLSYLRTLLLFNTFHRCLLLLTGCAGEFLADESDVCGSGGAVGLQDVELEIFEEMPHAVLQEDESFHKHPHIKLLLDLGNRLLDKGGIWPVQGFTEEILPM